MKNANVKRVGLGVFLTLTLTLASHAFLEAGTRSEGIMIWNVFGSETPTDCGTSLFVQAEDYTGRGVDSSFGPYVVEWNGCIDGSDFSGENPYAVAFDTKLTFSPLWDNGPDDDSMLVVACEDFPVFFDIPICLAKISPSVRCSVIEAAGRFHGAKGFIDLYGGNPIDFCSDLEFETFGRYTMHLRFPKGSKD